MFFTCLLNKSEPFRAVNALENHDIYQFFPSRCKVEMKSSVIKIYTLPTLENKGNHQA